MEQWKEIEGMPQYQISSYGRIKNKDGKILTGKDAENRITLCNEKKVIRVTVTGLVYRHFVENRFVRRFFYKDGNSRNIRADNLWSIEKRNEALLADYKNGMSISDLRIKYKVENLYGLGIKFGGQPKKLNQGLRIRKENTKLPEPTDPVILRLREKYRKLESDKREVGITLNQRINEPDVSSIIPKEHNPNAYLLRQFSYNY